MSAGTKYDPQQFINDCFLIVDCFGERRQQGFFTIGSYFDSEISITSHTGGVNIIERRTLREITVSDGDNLDEVSDHVKSLVLHLAVLVDESIAA